MPVCITGMHRSGTSMVARLLNLCGLYLGPEDKMMPPKPDNPAGFWENIDFAILNEKILSQMGGRWHSPPPLTKEGWERGPAFNALKNEAIEVTRVFVDREPWGWKDPRTSLTLNFWNGLFPNLKLVICLRDPLAVASSLQKRNRLSEAYGLQLWLTYNERLLTTADSGQYVVTHYDAYFSNPKRESRRILEWLGWVVSEEVIDQACETVFLSLRHNQFTTQELLKKDIPSEVSSLYSDMCERANHICGSDCANEILTQMGEKINVEAQNAYEIAQGLINDSKDDEAIVALEKLLEVHPEHTLAHNDIGVLYFRRGDKERALKHFKSSLQLDPKNITARRNLADLYLNLGRIGEALQTYEEILSENAEDLESLLILGNLSYQVGRLEDAPVFYKKVLSIEPDNLAAKAALEALLNSEPMAS